MSEIQDKVGYYSRAWKTNNAKCEAERQREAENWKFVSGVKFGQWPSESLELLNQEGRPPTQFNFIQGKVLTLAGSFLQNPLETKYEAEVGTPAWASDFLNKLLLMNKDCTSWSYAKSQFLLGMLTYRGILELYKDYSRSPMGDLGLRYVNPFTVAFDYRWKTSNIDDCKRVYIAQFMDAEDIFYKFKKKTPEIRAAYERLQDLIDDPNDQTETIDKIADRSPEYYDAVGQQYLVIQVLELKCQTRNRLFDIRTQEYMPDMDKDVADAIMKLGDNSQFLRELPDESKVLHVTTICPAMSKDLLLEDGAHPLQIGSYPYVVASALNLHGEAQGVVDVMKDPQVTINKRESTMTHWQTTAVNGAEMVEEGTFASNEEFLRYKKFKNKPGETFEVTEGSNQKKSITIRERGTPPNDLVESVNRATSHMDRMWAPPAVQALQGKSGESGKLFEEKKEQALVALEFMNKTLAEVDHQIGEKSFKCFKIIYSGPARRLKLSSGEDLLLNWPMDDGSTYNDISEIPRIAVRITQSQAGATVKRERLNLYTQYGQVITTPVMKATIELMMVDVIPNLPDSDKDQIKAIQMEYIQLLRKRTQAESAQIDMQLQASQGQGQPGQPGMVPTGPSPAGKTPAEGGGFSAEGKAIPPAGGLTPDVRAQNQLA